jgi:hypothetical protein
VYLCVEVSRACEVARTGEFHAAHAPDVGDRRHGSISVPFPDHLDLARKQGTYQAERRGARPCPDGPG